MVFPYHVNKLLKCLQGKEDMLRSDCRIEPVKVPNDLPTVESSSEAKINEIKNTRLVTDLENSKCDKEELKLLENNSPLAREKCDKLYGTDVPNIRIAKNREDNIMPEKVTIIRPEDIVVLE